jgi:transposase-like protein
LCLVDGLKGFPDAITAVFPQAMVQTGVVHLLRHSFDFVSWKGSEKQWIMPPREWSRAKGPCCTDRSFGGEEWTV